MGDNAGAGDGQNKNNGQGGNGSGPDNNANNTNQDQNGKGAKGGEKAFDEKVFEDPRLWEHPRFKSLNERAKKADALEKAQAEAEEKRLAEAKKFEELANKRATERDAATSKLQVAIQDNRIITEASKIGVVDIDAVLKLVDRSAIKVAEDGTVTGVTEALQALVTAKPFLKGKTGATTIGSGSAPDGDGQSGVKKFKLSQINNPEFYRKNEKDILEAYRTGNIEDDVNK